MPGISFLFKKRFHPSRLDNQKRLFVAEQTTAERNEREAESAKEVLKEKEMVSYEAMGAMEARDPRTSALKFMYAAPQSKDQQDGKKNPNVMASIKDYEAKVDQNGEDDMVKAFKAKIIQSKLKSLADIAGSNELEVGPALDPRLTEPIENITSKQSKPFTQPQSALEKEVGGKHKTMLTHDQLGERFACLRNAPMEGGYAKGMAVKHKPFNEVVRNVQCARCGEWGHRSGERECALRDYNPHDYARQQREDPMRMMGAPPIDSRSSKHIGSSSTSSSGPYLSSVPKQRCTFVDENGESDPEAEFLATLSRREKKLLLQKLQVLHEIHILSWPKLHKILHFYLFNQEIENGGAPVATGADDSSISSDDSSSDSSNNSSSSSESDSDSDKSRHRKRKHKHKSQKSSRKSKHRRKDVDHKRKKIKRDRH